MDNVTNAYQRLAECYLKNNQKFLAIDTLERAIANNPDNIDAYISLGNIYFEQDFMEESENIFLKAAKIDPKKSKAYIKNLGITYYNSQEDEKLNELYLKVIKIDPSLAAVIRPYLKL